jgi:cell division protease FtsH
VEIRTLVDTCCEEAKRLLEENTGKLHVMADALIKYETIGQEQLSDIMAGREPRPPEDWDDSEPDEPDEAVEVEPEAEKPKTKPPLSGPAGEQGA